MLALFLISLLGGGEYSVSHSGRFTPMEIAPDHWISCVDIRDRLVRVNISKDFTSVISQHQHYSTKYE
jgi:hypothetical protein